MLLNKISKLTLLFTGLLILILFSTVITCSVLKAQDITKTGFPMFKALVKQKGIYRTFEEFKNNAPSIPYDAEWIRIKELSKISDDPFSSYTLKFKKEQPLPCEKKTPIWGFCDGFDVFISRSKVFKENNIYDRVLYIGQYIYYRSTKTYGSGFSGGGSGMAAMTSTDVMDLAIHVKTKQVVELDEDNIRTIIAIDQDLLNGFDQQKDKRRILGAYFIKSLQRHPPK